jgi:hypothetical protein
LLEVRYLGAVFTLTFHTGHRRGDVVHHDQDRIVLGRAPDCNEIVPDEGVSRHHLELLIHEGRVWLRDLGSTKGTSIDGERVETRPVEAGVRVAMGPVEFTLAVSEITASDQLPIRERLGRLEDYRHLIRPEADHRLPEVPIPHPSYRASGKWVKPGLPPKVKRLRWISAFLAMFCLLLVAAIMIQESDKPVIIQALKVNLEANRAIKSSYGYGSVDYEVRGHCLDGPPMFRNHCGQLELAFDAPNGLAMLTFDVGSIDSTRELEIMLNDQSLGFAPVAIKSWLNAGYSVLLPNRGLVSGTNRLTLAHRQMARTWQSTDTCGTQQKCTKAERARLNAETSSWGVRNIHLRVHLAPPTSDPAKARELMTLGESRYRTRKVHPENLHAAAKAFRDAALLVYREDPRPPLFTRASERFAATDRELTVRFRQEFMAALKEIRFGNIDSSCLILNQLAMRFPDKLDWRYAQTQAGLQAVCEGNR